MQRPASGKVPVHCSGTSDNISLPVLGRVPSPYCGSDPDLVLKVTNTGVTFLGNFDEGTRKYSPTGRFRKRYTGSKTCKIDINGKLFLSNAEYEKAAGNRDNVKNRKTCKEKTKKAGTPPCFLISCVDALPEQTTIGRTSAISSNYCYPATFAIIIAKKDRKKSYSVNKPQVRQRLYGMLNSQKGKKHLYFWTVTFPEGTPDDVCYKAFNTWLTSLRKFRMLKDYLWIAERQDGKRAPDKEPTNTLHFHIAVPHYMDVYKANAMMRGTLKNLAKQGHMPGAVCSTTDKKECYFLRCIAKYNGVDICKHRATRRIINFAVKKGSVALVKYLTKYVTKNDTAFEHLAWHNSRGFSALFTGTTFTLTEFTNLGFGHFLNRVRVFKMRFAVFVPWLYGPPPMWEDHLYKLNSYIQTLQDGTTT